MANCTCWDNNCTAACNYGSCAYHDCQNSCNGGCGGGCKGCGSGCAGGCTGCGSGCASGCSSTCKGGCNTTCTNTCKTLCNSSCSNSVATSLANLTLATLIEDTDMTNIQTLLQQEKARRPSAGTVTNVTFTVGNSATASSMTTLLANLKAIGKTSSYVATAGEIITRALGEDIITKALAASKETVKIS